MDEKQARSAIAEGVGFNALHRGSFFKVDLFPCASEFDREAMRRASIGRTSSAGLRGSA